MLRLSSLLIAAAFVLVKGVTGFGAVMLPTQSRTSCLSLCYNNGLSHNNMSGKEIEEKEIISSFQRRSLLISTMMTSCGYCSCHFPSSANALVELTQPSTTDFRPRNKFIDNFFAHQMATEMSDYEREIQKYKADLFQKLFYSLSDGSGTSVPVVVEVGMGTFPNAKYYAQALSSSGLKGFDIVGVDPNDSMSSYAHDNARVFGLNSLLRTINGVAEALPFADKSVDAIVTTLTLCSVFDQEKALSEMRRVLKPNTGKYLFWEHVLAEDDTALAFQQDLLNPLQTFAADGCHLNRRTGMNIQKAFEGKVDLNYITLEDKWVLGPTVFGIASA